VAKVLFEKFDGDGLERAGAGRDLSEDVDAVHVAFHHPMQPANLSFDPTEPL
jgi:hypothetical protein